MNNLNNIEFDMVERKNNSQLVTIDPIETKKIIRELQVLQKIKTKDLAILSDLQKNLNYTLNQFDMIHEDENYFNYYGLSKTLLRPSKS